VIALSGTAAPLTAVTAEGFDEPELVPALLLELGLGLAPPPVALDAVITDVEEVLMFEFASAERT
jgi:hypothetical protein